MSNLRRPPGKTSPADIAALASSQTVAVALPCTPFGLAESEYTPAQAILDAGGLLALASDLNPGTLDLPFASIPRAVTASVPGDTILLRGGTYIIGTPVNISRQGTADSMYHLYAFPGERPFLNCSTMTLGARGINLTGRYWHVRGLHVYRAGDNGMRVSGSYNTIEFCSFSENFDTGLSAPTGVASTGSRPSASVTPPWPG